MNHELTGKLLVKQPVQVISDRFKKREFVLELVEDTPNGSFTNYAKMQLVQNKTDLLDRFNEGDMLKATFNIRGSRYDKNGVTNYITNLDVWRLEPADAAGANNSGGAYNQPAYADNNAPTGGYNSGNFGSGNAPFGGNNNYANSAPASAPAPATDAPAAGDDLPF